MSRLSPPTIASTTTGAARTSGERLLGSDDETARYLAHLPFTREIAVGDGLASSLAEARVPATVALEVRKALAGTLDLEREMGVGDRFYVRYRQPFTVDGTPIGTAQLIWLELRTTAKGTVALHRFRPKGGSEQLWLANGDTAGSAALRMPLDVINVSSGFGLRPDPLDKPEPPKVEAPTPPPPKPRLFMHDGLDLVAVSGTEIYAAADGVVTGAGPNGRNTGRSTGAHLHFEIVANGRTVNPLTFPGIKRTQLTGADLARFKKQVKHSLEERDREARVDAAILGLLN